MPLDEKHVKLVQSKEEDRRAAFITTAAIHLVNQASIEALRKVAQSKYDHPINNFDHRTFRPNILIDFDPAYVEEELLLIKVGDSQLR
jgi:uncharacterized protein YcbX